MGVAFLLKSWQFGVSFSQLGCMKILLLVPGAVLLSWGNWAIADRPVTPNRG